MSYNAVLVYLLIINLLGFITVIFDKNKAKRRRFRVPEKYFFLIGVLGGALGVYLGMRLFRHKTRHRRFVYGIPLLIVVNLFMLYFFMKEFNIN